MKSLFFTLALVAHLVFGASISFADTPPSINDRLDVLANKVDALTKEVKSADNFVVKSLVPLLSALTGIVALLVTYRLTKGSWDQARDNADRALRMQRAENEAKVIRDKLDTFFGPLSQLLATSSILYEALKSAQSNPADFRALKAVLDGQVFDSNSKMILEEIIELGKSAERLIAEKAGLIDEDIEEILWKLQAHYRVLRLAYSGAIKGEFARFEKYVFPREMDKAIREKTSNLKKRMTWLMSHDDPA